MYYQDCYYKSMHRRKMMSLFLTFVLLSQYNVYKNAIVPKEQSVEEMIEEVENKKIRKLIK